MIINNYKSHKQALLSSATVLFALAAPMPLSAAADDGKDTTMPTVVVKDTAQTQTQGYQSSVTTVGKMSQAAKDIPQSLTTVTNDLMQDQNAATLHDALRNVAGLTFNAGEGGRIGDNITIRGFSASSDLYLDGMRDNAQYNRDTFNLERVEVLQGASSMLFGRGSTGGIVNQVSKEPQLHQESEIEETVGSHDYTRETADINQKVTDTAAVRFDVMKNDNDFAQDVADHHSWGVAPSLRWGIGTDDEFLVSYYHLEYADTPNFGIPIPSVEGGKPIRERWDNYYGYGLVDYQDDSADIYTGRWIHKFGNGMELKTLLRRNDVDRDLRGVAPRVDTAVTTVTRGRQARGAVEGNTTGSADLSDKFEILGMKHEALIGSEYVRETSDRWSYLGTPGDPSTSAITPNPFTPLPNGYSATYQRINPLTYVDHNLGFYGQDIVEFVPHWKLLAGARLDDFHADYDSITTSSGALTTYTRTDLVPSYRTGLMYQPDDYSTYYLAYGTAFNPSGDVYSVEATQPARSGKTPPEKSINYELGSKWELMQGNLSLRTAVFRTEKTNERNTDPSIPDIYLLSGKRHTDGIEFESAGRVTKNWEIFTSIAWMTAEIDKQINPYAVGLRPVNTPTWSGNVWSTYKIASDWKVGGGANFVGKRLGYSIPTNNTPAVLRYVPGYARFDAVAEWEFLPKTSLKLNIFNLLNQRYYDAIYPNGGFATPGLDRTVQLSLAYKF